MTVCCLDTYKRVDKVIRALPLILQDFPEVIYWVVGDGPLKQGWQRLTIELGVDDRVHFWGRVNGQMLIKTYKQEDIFIMPSTGEGFGIVFFEAWQYGLPVIGSNVDACLGVIGSFGITVDPTDIQAIADRVKDWFFDAEKSRMLSRMGYERLLGNYTLKSYCDNLSKILCSSVIGK